VRGERMRRGNGTPVNVRRSEGNAMRAQ